MHHLTPVRPVQHAVTRAFMVITLSCVLIASIVVGCDKQQPPHSPPMANRKAVSTVPAARLARLRLGVNLSHWHWLPRTEAGYLERDDFIAASEFEALAKAGATHVRLPIQPADLWDEATNSMKPQGDVPTRLAIQKILDSGLAVIVDAHPTQQDWKTIEPGTGRMVKLERFWDQFGAALATSNPDPERVFIELLNEPQGIKDPADWATAQESLLRVVRQHFPAHTVIASGDEWGGVDGLLRTTPLLDSNVIYSFHTYDPAIFTHQGATWSFEPWRHMRDVPYPFESKSMKPIIAATQDKAARNTLTWESREAWNAAKVRQNIKQAADWSEGHGVPVYCGEFGVYAKFTKRADRLAWLQDVTAALDDFGIGRAMWEYYGDFGLADGPPGERVLDADVARTIGLMR